MHELLGNPYWGALATEQAGVALGGALGSGTPANGSPPM